MEPIRSQGEACDDLQRRDSTLSAAVDKAGLVGIDLMSVDVERAKPDVLASPDLTRLTPRMLVVETKYPERITALPRGPMGLTVQLCVHDDPCRALYAESA